MLWLVIHHLQTLGVLKDGSGAGFNSVQLYLNSRSYNMTVLGRKTHTSSMQVHQSAENWPGWRGPGGAQFVVSDPSLADSPQPHPGPSFSRLYIFLLISKGATAGNRFHMGSPGSVSTGPPPQPRAQTEVSQLRVKETQMVENPSSQVWGHFELA